MARWATARMVPPAVAEMRRGKVDEVGPRVERPFAPRRDDFDVGVERVSGQLEADLVVAFAGGAMGDRVGTAFRRDLDQSLGDQRPGNRRSEKVDAFIEGI